jgi:hypothetical protein
VRGKVSYEADSFAVMFVAQGCSAECITVHYRIVQVQSCTTLIVDVWVIKLNVQYLRY